MEVSGHLRKKDIAGIIQKSIGEVPLADGLDIDGILEVAQPLCNTPAEYTAFIEKARSLRSTEYEVLVRLRSLASKEKVSLANFIKFNFKTLIGILEAVNAPPEISAKIRSGMLLAALKASSSMERLKVRAISTLRTNPKAFSSPKNTAMIRVERAMCFMKAV